MLRALNWLKSKFKLSEVLELGKAALDAPEASSFPEHLERMRLTSPQGLKEICISVCCSPASRPLRNNQERRSPVGAGLPAMRP